MRAPLAAVLISALLAGCSSSNAGVKARTSNSHVAGGTDSSTSVATTPSSDAPPVTPAAAPTTEPTPPSLPEGASGVGDELYPDLGNPGIDVDHYELDLSYDPAT